MHRATEHLQGCAGLVVALKSFVADTIPPSGTILPNSPLSSVAFEAKFVGDLNLLTRWGSFQDRVRGRYPQLFVPPAIEGTAPTLQPLKLASGDGADSINISLNSFAFETRAYKSFEEFRERVGSAARDFVATCGERNTNRFGLRYINSLPPLSPMREGGFLHPALKIRLSGWEPKPASQTFPPALVYTSEVENLGLRVAVMPTEAPGSQQVQSGLILDLDCFVAGANQLSSFLEFLEKSHDVIRRTFFSLVTDDYLRYLKGA